jgi:tetratricopeptide (TPR) repeat protein
MNPQDELGSDLVKAQAQNDLASTWMKRGIALLEENSSASLRESLVCFDQAIALRSVLPLGENSFFRYCFIAGWMNRGDALTRLGSASDLAEAVRSYDEALKHARLLPLDENPLYRKRFAVAWLNRGITLQQQKKNLAEAAHSFGESVALLGHENAATIPEQKQLLGCAWMNLGNVMLESAEPDLRSAAASVRNALRCLAEVESHDLISAEAGLKARLVLCRAVAGLISEPPTVPATINDLVAEATDTVDSGMKLVREWETQKSVAFRELSQELFRFGAHVYQKHQPHFLVEFLLESLDPCQSPGAAINSAMHLEALRALRRSLREMQREGLNRLNASAFDSFLQRLAEMSSVEQRLEELRKPGS